MSEYRDNWITTYSGWRFHYLNPKPDEINIHDIAHALSLKCRFSGHCKCLYTVGEHSIRVAELLSDNLKLSGLLHDATEAYMPDVVRPIKERFGLREYEDKIWAVIAKKYGVEMSKEVKVADDTLIATEARDLMPNMTGWKRLPLPLYEHIYPIVSTLAVETIFLAKFREYGGVDGRGY